MKVFVKDLPIPVVRRLIRRLINQGMVKDVSAARCSFLRRYEVNEIIEKHNIADVEVDAISPGFMQLITKEICIKTERDIPPQVRVLKSAHSHLIKQGPMLEEAAQIYINAIKKDLKLYINDLLDPVVRKLEDAISKLEGKL